MADVFSLRAGVSPVFGGVAEDEARNLPRNRQAGQTRHGHSEEFPEPGETRQSGAPGNARSRYSDERAAALRGVDVLSVSNGARRSAAEPGDEHAASGAQSG